MTEGRRPPRKLLVAAVGAATISYVSACSDGDPTSGNLAPPPDSGAADSGVISGNLVAPDSGPAFRDAGFDSGSPISGNLAPPPDAGLTKPLDGGAQADSATDEDAGAIADGAIEVFPDGSPISGNLVAPVDAGKS